MECAVFLDRDNTLIANDGDLGDPDRVQLLRGVPDGLHALRQAGYRLIVVTNQGGVARGRFTEDDVDAVHQRIAALVDQATGQSDLINRFYYCPYHPKATLEDYRRDHPWRKPSPGMLLQAARDMNIDLGQSWMVGDQPRDMTAGRSAGCRTVYLGPATPPASETPPTVTAPDFPAAVQHILRVTPPRPAGSGSPPPEADPAGPGRGNPMTRHATRMPVDDTDALPRLARNVAELTDLVRHDRARRAEFSGYRLAAGMGQLLVLLLAALGLTQLGSSELFFQWMTGAVLVQLATIALLLLDQRG